MQDRASNTIQASRADEMRRVMDEYATYGTSTQSLYTQAQSRVKAKIGFYSHLISYLMVNAFLIVSWFVTSLSAGGFIYPWFIWPLFGWGIGLMSHFFSVYSNTGKMKQRLFEAEMRKLSASETPISANHTYERR